MAKQKRKFLDNVTDRLREMLGELERLINPPPAPKPVRVPIPVPMRPQRRQSDSTRRGY